MIDLENLRRNSGISLDRDGRFHHEGSPIENDRIQTLFRASLEVREDGEVLLRVGKQWCYVHCEGVALFVRSVCRREGEGLELTLSDDSREMLQNDSLRIVENNDLYCAVKEGFLNARFLRGAYHQVAAFFEDASNEGSEACVLRLGEQRSAVTTLEEPPGITFR
jgi:hypothetical protein